MNIKETQELLGFVIAIGNAAGKSAEDGRVGFDDLMHFFDAYRKASPAFAGISGVPAELKDLDAAEAQALKDYVEEEFDIPQDVVEAVVERGISIAIDMVRLVAELLPGEPESAA